MSDQYRPDCWVIVKITRPEETIYKVLGGWAGGYLYGNSWRMNSGIVRHEKIGDYYHFFGQSGSEYKCYEDAEGLRMSIAPIYESVRRWGEEQGIEVSIIEAEDYVKQHLDN